MITKTDLLSPLRLPMKQWTTPLHRFILLLFLLLANNVWAQEKEVNGKVTSAEGNPLIGVSIHVKGTDLTTSTGDNGQFTLTTKPGSVLLLSYVGFSTHEYVLGNETSINVTMTSSESQLDEVVVIGYGTQRKEAVTGSVASVSGDKMREVPSGNVSRALQGRVAGVEMSQNSSKPGS